MLPVTDCPRVVLELAGLVLGALPPRTFVLRLDDLTEPFILFDGAHSQTASCASGSLPAGLYWLLHRATDALVGAEQRYEWADGGRALSLVRIRPGAEAVLEGGPGSPWHFGATLTPFSILSGNVFPTKREHRLLWLARNAFCLAADRRDRFGAIHTMVRSPFGP